MFELHDFTIWMKRIAIFTKLQNLNSELMQLHDSSQIRHSIFVTKILSS
jgi:hypothetical protein